MESFIPELKHFGWRLLSLVIVTPIAGYGLLLITEFIENAWQTNERKKKWFALCILFAFVAVLLFGWLR